MASLTKEELKTALINHGLSPPPASARKEEFLAMYAEHVAPVEDEAGEFSSDDEVSTSPKKKVSQSSAKSNRSSTKSPKKGKKNGATNEDESLIVGEINLNEVDDDQLFELLKENGISAGPIVDSTRPFYKKKLALALRGENGVVNGSNGDFSDTEPEDEEVEDDQPSAVTTPQERRTSTRSKASSSSKKSAVASPKSEVTKGLRKRFNATMDELDSSRNTPTPRRSIHTYKVSETTKQTIKRTSDGNETKDTVHMVERTETKGGDSDASAAFFSLRKLALLMLVLALLAGLVFILSKQKAGDLSVEKIIGSLKDSIKSSPSSGEEPLAATAPPPPVKRDIPEQGAQTNV